MVGRGIGAVLALLALTASGMQAETPASLSLGTGVTVEAPGGLLRIDTRRGDYVAGRIEAGTLPLSAELLGPDGSPFRLLTDGATGTTDFRAVAEGEGLLLRIAAAGPMKVTLDMFVPVEAQVAPPTGHDSPRISALAETLAAGGTTEAFWAGLTAEGTPLIEDTPKGKVMTFLWRGAKRNVRLFGGPAGDHVWLDRLGNSDVWFKSFPVPEDTRLSYQLAPDIPDLPADARTRRVAILATAQEDPLNRHPWPADGPDRFNRNSTVTLPDAPAQPGTPPVAEADPVPDRFTFASPTLGNSREITLAMPRGFDPADPRLVLAFLFDGEKMERQIAVPAMLDTLTRQGDLPPVVAVLIPSLGSETRSRELPGNDAFADALAQELLPQVAARLGLHPDPARTVLAGASYGGLASATVALRHPEAFGNVLSMSGSFWWAPEGVVADGIPFVAAEFAAREKLPVRFVLTAGRFELGRDGTPGILDTSRQLRDVLRIKGYPVIWRDYGGGHDWLVWRGALAEGLIALFGEEAQP